MTFSLFISDLHLCAEHPESQLQFQHFCAKIAPKAEALYILGDLFEYWAGDDDIHDDFHRKIIQSIQKLSAQKTRVFIMHGNRDLLMGTALANACKATLLDDPTQLNLYGISTLLCHGDTLCTDDIEYQHFRATVHDLNFQENFLAQPLAVRKNQIVTLRKNSNLAKKHKDSAIMDVNESTVTTLLRSFNYPRLIHGHTHRPNRHEHLVDGHLCERWVLGDWHQKGSALQCDIAGCQVINFESICQLT